CHLRHLLNPNDLPVPASGTSASAATSSRPRPGHRKPPSRPPQTQIGRFRTDIAITLDHHQHPDRPPPPPQSPPFPSPPPPPAPPAGKAQAKSQGSIELGTTLGPHAMPPPRTTRMSPHRAHPPQGGIDQSECLPPCPGVKGSPVQIRPSRRRSEG